MKREYQRIVLAIGARQARDLNVPGRELEGVRLAVDYLTDATKSVLKNGTKASKELEGKKVMVIGGGDTGNDCIATAIRQGAADVKQLEITRRPPSKRPADNPWPQWPRVAKTGYGQEEANELFEGVLTQYETTAVGFEGVDGHVSSVTTCHAQLFKPVPGTEEKHPVDLVLLAMGFTGAQKQFLDEFGVTEVNDDYTTNDEKVYVAGDARRGPSLVIWGIHEGRMAAEKVNEACKAAAHAE